MRGEKDDSVKSITNISPVLMPLVFTLLFLGITYYKNHRNRNQPLDISQYKNKHEHLDIRYKFIRCAKFLSSAFLACLFVCLFVCLFGFYLSIWLSHVAEAFVWGISQVRKVCWLAGQVNSDDIVVCNLIGAGSATPLCLFTWGDAIIKLK